jgi:dsRNA-specific ribonuclease
MYEVIHEEGPDHKKKFTIVFKINNKVIGKGVGKVNKKHKSKQLLVALNT